MGVSFNFLINIIKIMRTSLLTLAFLIGLISADKQLKFDSKGNFKMVQFTDIHFGEGYDTDVKN